MSLPSVSLLYSILILVNQPCQKRGIFNRSYRPCLHSDFSIIVNQKVNLRLRDESFSFRALLLLVNLASSTLANRASSTSVGQSFLSTTMERKAISLLSTLSSCEYKQYPLQRIRPVSPTEYIALALLKQ